jgi:hypothetical protein
MNPPSHPTDKNLRPAPMPTYRHPIWRKANPMPTNQHELASFIWQIADLLRGPYRSATTRT